MRDPIKVEIDTEVYATDDKFRTYMGDERSREDVLELIAEGKATVLEWRSPEAEPEILRGVSQEEYDAHKAGRGVFGSSPGGGTRIAEGFDEAIRDVADRIHWKGRATSIDADGNVDFGLPSQWKPVTPPPA